MKLVTAATMREMDRRTIEEFNIPGIVLMENAALRVVEAIVERSGPLDGKRVTILCGKGNNGGDGFAIARHLLLRYQANVNVVSTFDPSTISGDGDAAVNLRMAQSAGVPITTYTEGSIDLSQADIIVDALFGTGFRGPMEGDAATIVETINKLRRASVRSPQNWGLGGQNPATSASAIVPPVRFPHYWGLGGQNPATSASATAPPVRFPHYWGLGGESRSPHNSGLGGRTVGGRPFVAAVDIPSGVNADTGDVDGAAIEADLTVTFALAKPGLFCFPGAKNAGDLVVGDICMPRAVIDEASAFANTTEPTDVARWLPRRENGRDSNKGKFGHVLVLTGSRGFLGAANMASHAAARAGAGLVTLAVPESLLPGAMSAVNPVIMTRGLAETGEGTFSLKALDTALEQAGKSTVVAMGPGIGAHVPETAEFVREFIRRCPVPMVIDADALNILSDEPDHGTSIITARSAATVLTPHPGEMGRLIGKSTRDVQADRFDIVREAADRYRCTVLLKGSRTLIASGQSQSLNINTTGNAGMATGGAGDVLTGIIAALLGMGLDPHAAASAGAYVHGLSGDIAAEQHGGEAGLIATDLIDHLPAALGRVG